MAAIGSVNFNDDEATSRGAMSFGKPTANDDPWTDRASAHSSQPRARSQRDVPSYQRRRSRDQVSISSHVKPSRLQGAMASGKVEHFEEERLREELSHLQQVRCLPAGGVSVGFSHSG